MAYRYSRTCFWQTIASLTRHSFMLSSGPVGFSEISSPEGEVYNQEKLKSICDLYYKPLNFILQTIPDMPFCVGFPFLF